MKYLAWKSPFTGRWLVAEKWPKDKGDWKKRAAFISAPTLGEALDKLQARIKRIKANQRSWRERRKLET